METNIVVVIFVAVVVAVDFVSQVLSQNALSQSNSRIL